MNNPLANLSSLERRFVVGVGVVIFVILNLVFVRPRFQDRILVQSRLVSAEKRLADFNKAITNAAPLEKEIAAFEKQGDAQLPQEDQSAEFIKTIQNAAIQTGVNIVSMQRSQTRTNDQFFIEQAQNTRLTSKEENLVNFLHLLSGAIRS